MKAIKTGKGRSFPWDWIYMPLLYIILFWSVVQLAYGGEDGPMDIIQSILNAIGLSQQSVTLIMLVLALGLVIWFTIAKYCKTLKFLKENVGTTNEKQGPANKGIGTIIDGIEPLSKMADIEKNAKAAASGISSANATLHDLDKSVEVLKIQAENIRQLQLTNPREAQAFQGAEAAFLSLAEDLVRQRQENEQLREELSNCRKEIEALKKQVNEPRPSQRRGMQPHL